MATVSTQKITTLGPIKMEVVHLTTVSDADTFTTLIQNPKFAIAGEFAANANSTVQTQLSGRTVTIQNPTTASGQVVVLVFGF